MKKGIEIEVNNGQTLFLTQVSKDGDVVLHRWDGETMQFERLIQAGNMVMLLNLYRYVKDNDIHNDFINPDGKNKEQKSCGDEAPKWKSVKVAPPKEEKVYLVQLDCGSLCECRWTDGDYLFGRPTGVWRWHFLDIPKYTKIVAWMERPELYKEE